MSLVHVLLHKFLHPQFLANLTFELANIIYPLCCRLMIGQHLLSGMLAGHHGVPAYPGQMPGPGPQHHPMPSTNPAAQPTFIYQVSMHSQDTEVTSKHN